MNQSCTIQNTSPSPTQADADIVRWFLRQASDSGTGGTAFDMNFTAQALLPLTGWPKTAFLPNLRKAMLAPRNLTILKQQHHQQYLGNNTPYCLILPDAYGNDIPVTAHPRPIETPEGTIVVLSFYATSNENETVEKLTSERSRLRTQLDKLPAFIALIEPNGTIRDHNKEFENVFGSGIGKQCQAILDAQDSSENDLLPADAFNTATLAIAEWTSRSTGRSYRNYTYPVTDEDGCQLVQILGIDITQSKKVQHALELSEERYRSITDNLTMAIAVVDESFNVSATNPLFCQWFGDVKKLTKGVIARTSLPHQLPLLQETLKSKTINQNTFTQTLDGIERLYKLTTCPIATSEQETALAIALIEDITESQQVEARLQRAHKLEAMGTLTTGIAHEINQPLSALHLYASGLEMLVEQQRDLPTETLQTRLSWILREADKIREIISHMRTLALQEETPVLRAVPVNRAIEQALSLIGVQLSSHGISVRQELDSTDPVAICNTVQLEQVMINLLVNAMHALDTLDIPEKHIIIRSTTDAEEHVILQVIDNGPGIEGLEHRIFDPFFTTKDTSAGMGLGLSIVHTFVESWGGEISAKTRAPSNSHDQPAGCCFTVKLLNSPLSAFE